MHFKVMVAFIVLGSLPIFVNADEASIDFKVKPDRCIALRQGQYCYQKLKFSWSAIPLEQSSVEQAGTVEPEAEPKIEFCLIKEEGEQRLVCWYGSEMTKYQYEFESPGEQVFYLRNMKNAQRIAELRVKVAWVYKNSEKVSNGWRLF